MGDIFVIEFQEAGEKTAVDPVREKKNKDDAEGKPGKFHPALRFGFRLDRDAHHIKRFPDEEQA